MKTLFWCGLQKRSSCVFMETLGAIFEVKQRWAPLLPGFSWILSTVSANQYFRDGIALPPATTLLFITVSILEVISWFIKIDL